MEMYPTSLDYVCLLESLLRGWLFCLGPFRNSPDGINLVIDIAYFFLHLLQTKPTFTLCTKAIFVNYLLVVVKPQAIQVCNLQHLVRPNSKGKILIEWHFDSEKFSLEMRHACPTLVLFHLKRQTRLRDKMSFSLCI